MEKTIDLKEFMKQMGISKVTALQWIKDKRVSYTKKPIAFNRFKYLIPETEVKRIKALRS